MFDILIKNGTIVDGLRNKPYKSSIGIKNGRIVKISSNLKEEDAREIIDAENLVVAPGFIDIHTHSDTSFLMDNRSESKIFQGVTTEVVGQCGYSYYMNSEEIEKTNRDINNSSILRDFIEKANKENKKMSINWATFVGHNSIRVSVMGQEGRKATKEEINKMVELLNREMEAGAWGLSLGLGYPPGIFSDIEELVALGEVVAKHNGMISSHMRNQGARIYEALDEMFEINRQTKAHVHISHLKLSGRPQWGKAEELLKFLKDAQAEGINVTSDIYPYEAASSGITNVLPKWALAGGDEGAVARFKTEEREKIIAELWESFQDPTYADRIYIVSTNGLYPIADDKTIRELSEELNISPAEAVEQIVVNTNGNCNQICFAMDEKDMLRMIREIDIAIGSDGSGLPMSPEENNGKPHPRNFGTFPRFLRLAREHNMMPIEDAVYKMTALSADILGFTDRGRLKEDYAADITIFNPNIVSDKATYKNPFQKPMGIEYVIVNGEIAVKKGVQTENRAGEFLLS